MMTAAPKPVHPNRWIIVPTSPAWATAGCDAPRVKTSGTSDNSLAIKHAHAAKIISRTCGFTPAAMHIRVPPAATARITIGITMSVVRIRCSSIFIDLDRVFDQQVHACGDSYHDSAERAVTVPA